jgi:hypothetical protein
LGGKKKEVKMGELQKFESLKSALQKLKLGGRIKNGPKLWG